MTTHRTTYRTLRPTVYVPMHDAAAARRALRIWLATGAVPVAHIVAEPDAGEEPAEGTMAA